VRALNPLACRVNLIGGHVRRLRSERCAHCDHGESGFAGAIVDTTRKYGSRLADYMDIAAIGNFVDRARSHGLSLGLPTRSSRPTLLLLLAPTSLDFAVPFAPTTTALRVSISV
jgi:hypothetical protein